MKYQSILLIDDDEDDHEIFLSAIKELELPIHCTGMMEATKALAKLAAKEIAPDVIFLDLNMPVMNGQQFLVEIKKNTALKNIPVIIFSTSSHFSTIQLVKELGAQHFITKPDKYADLVNILKPLLS